MLQTNLFERQAHACTTGLPAANSRLGGLKFNCTEVQSRLSLTCLTCF